jgi:peptidoglycan-associated lipoprotein
LWTLLVISVAACGSKRPNVPLPPPPPPAVDAAPAPPPPPPPDAPASPAATATEAEIFARKTLAELNAEKPLGYVYFELDSSSLSESGRKVLQSNAEWLKRWSSVRVMIEGHCDERGTAEYNLALGDRRARAVHSYLVSLGVAADRLAAVSKGKEQPLCSEPHESCWQQNRRGHFVITAK